MWLTSDPAWLNRWQRAVQKRVPVTDRVLSLRVSGRIDHPMRIDLLEPECPGLSLESSMPLQAANQRPRRCPLLHDRYIGPRSWIAMRLE